MTLTNNTVILVSVIRDFQMYHRCIADNPNANIFVLNPIDNRKDNANVSVQYNRFLDTYDFSYPAWFIFCHEDFELRAPPGDFLKQARHDQLFGPIGAITKIKFKILHQWCLVGQILESKKDGSDETTVGQLVPIGTPVETFDCQCLIVHSDLIRETGLRFDPHLSFDLYIEDFCIQAKEKFNIPSLILPLPCKHWSNGQVGERYYEQEQYLKFKYKHCCYTGTSSYAIGHPSFWRTCNIYAKKIIKILLRLKTQLLPT